MQIILQLSEIRQNQSADAGRTFLAENLYENVTPKRVSPT